MSALFHAFDGATVADALSAVRGRVVAFEARLLLREALAIDAAALAAHPERRLGAPEVARFEAWIRAREQGRPIAYILGYREFYGRRFAVSPAVLIPRPETELLVDLALARCDSHSNPKVLDLGTGSGAIAITIQCERPAARVVAVESCGAALELARANAAALAAEVTITQGSWFASLPAEKFDVIVANPPYVANQDPHLQAGDLCHEPLMALVAGPLGTEALEVIIRSAPAYLGRAGWLLVEHGFDQAVHCRALLHDAGFDSVRSWQDLAGLDRVSGGCMA